MIQRLFGRIWRRKSSASDAANFVSVSHLHKTLVMVAGTRDQELDCADAYTFLDSYADRISRGEDAAALMPLVHHHLALCPDCSEELDALLRALEATP